MDCLWCLSTNIPQFPHYSSKIAAYWPYMMVNEILFDFSLLTGKSKQFEGFILIDWFTTFIFPKNEQQQQQQKKKPVSALNKRTGALVIHQPQVTDLSLPSGESNEWRQFRVVHELLSSSWLEGMELRRWCCFLSAAHSCELSTQRPQTRRELLGTLLHGKPRWMDYRRTEQKPSSPSYFIQEKKNNSRPRLPLNRKRAGMLRAATVSETRARLMISI